MSEALRRLSQLAGIEPSYRGYWGDEVTIEEVNQRALLVAMGYDVADDASALAEFERHMRARAIPPAIVVKQGAAFALPPGGATWQLELEGGRRFDGDLTQLPLGYHLLTVRSEGRETSATVIVVPPRCYLPPELEHGRTWALSTQLYALRSQANWGIGDFRDLATLAAIAGKAGASAIAVNPLHQLHPGNPQAASPYGPSSRLFLNTLYIDASGVPELAESQEAQALIASPQFQARLAMLRAEDLVDYAGVARAKRDVLELLFSAFRTNHGALPGGARGKAFEDFVREGGLALERLARYEALDEWFRAGDPQCQGWQQWPTAYRVPDSTEVERFAAQRRERVEFHLYLQWLAHEQLAGAARTGAAHGTHLYRDLAVGCDINGADAWADQQSISSGASLGAPADPLNELGQNWGLPPFSPHALRERAYAPFAALLRANMRHARILRIDHVMALRRAFWIPRGFTPGQGAYVRYPFEEMLGILALESVRNRCAIVGEDLGTVPDGFRERLQDACVLSSRVLYFERDWSDGSFLAPQCYPKLAAASAGTHDLPTLLGWWTGDDVAVRARIGIYPDAMLAEAAADERRRARLALVGALERCGAADATAAARLRDDARRGGTAELCDELAAAVHRFLGCTTAAIVVLAIEDVLGEIAAVNVPGTFDEHPNWRRKRCMSLEELQTDRRLTDAGAIMRDAKVGAMESTHS